MNSRQLEYFLAVAHELNFTKAAESMYVSQTAVTQQIKALEEQLGVSLFERTKKKVVLTPAGKVFLQEASSILNRIDTAVERTREASSGVIGSLEIGFSVGIGNTGLAEKIQAFNEKYPNIAMKFTNQSPSMLLKMLKNGDLDLVLMPMFEERYYQNVLFIVCRLMGLYVQAEYHTSYGRADMILQTKDYIYIFEFKLDGSVEEALQQIESQEYARPFEMDGRKLVKIGVNFDSRTRSMDKWQVVY